MPYHANPPTEKEGDESSKSSSSEEDLGAEILQGIPWQCRPVRAFLVEKLATNDFPADYNTMGPFDVWNKYCDQDVFEGMEYDAAFRHRLLALRKQFLESAN